MKVFKPSHHSLVLKILAFLMIFLSSNALLANKTADSPLDTYYFGVYLYSNHLEAAADEANIEYFTFLDEHFAILAKHHINCVHLTITKPEHMGKYLQLAKKYSIKIQAQLDFVYFRPEWTADQMQKTATEAIAFLQKWKNSPEVLAWSVKEEPYPQDVEKLEKYYDLIIKEIPDLKLFLNCHWASPYNKLSTKYSFQFVGGDYYFFSWDQQTADKAHLRTPREALDSTRTITKVFYDAAKKHSTNYFHIFPAAAALEPNKADGWASGKTLPDKWSETQKQEYIQKIERLANNNEDGWSRFENLKTQNKTNDTNKADKPSKLYNLWKMYLPPTNCIKALAWSGIFNGAKSSMCFFYSPASKKYSPKSAEDSVYNYRTERFYTNLAGRPGVPCTQFEELAQASKEIRAYAKIITRWQIAGDSPVCTNEKEFIFNQAFTLKGIEGKAVLIHNADVGKLECEACKEAQLECKHMFIDEHGNVANFHPYTKAKQITFTLEKTKAKSNADVNVFRADTGDELTSVNGQYKIDIDPGSAVILFIGNKANAAKLRKLYCVFD